MERWTSIREHGVVHLELVQVYNPKTGWVNADQNARSFDFWLDQLLDVKLPNGALAYPDAEKSRAHRLQLRRQLTTAIRTSQPSPNQYEALLAEAKGGKSQKYFFIVRLREIHEDEVAAAAQTKKARRGWRSTGRAQLFGQVSAKEAAAHAEAAERRRYANAHLTCCVV